MTVARILLGAGLLSLVVGAPASALAQGGLAPGGCGADTAFVGGAGGAVAPQTALGSSRLLSLAQCRAYCEQLEGCLGLSYREDSGQRVDAQGLPAAAGDARASCTLFWSIARTSGEPGTTSCRVGRAPSAAEPPSFSKLRDAFDRIDREVRQDTVRPPRPCTNPQTC